jgi:hypothetical protein
MLALLPIHAANKRLRDAKFAAQYQTVQQQQEQPLPPQQQQQHQQQHQQQQQQQEEAQQQAAPDRFSFAFAGAGFFGNLEESAEHCSMLDGAIGEDGSYDQFEGLCEEEVDLTAEVCRQACCGVGCVPFVC